MTRSLRWWSLIAVACWWNFPVSGASLRAAELPDLSTVPTDLEVPATVAGEPAPGVRVIQTTAGWEGTRVHHTLYLPADWERSRQWPVLVDFPGNGNFRNRFGDVSDGSVEGCRLGYGISGGRGHIWVAMPFVEVREGVKQNAAVWWGDVEESKRYCIATVREVCARFGGDADAVVMCGFSRGSIACNFIGLHDDEIARLWRAFICHSHYDGVNERWPYAGADRASALARLRRLGERPQFISNENSMQATEDWLAGTGIRGHWSFEPIPFRNHSADWTLRDTAARRKVRAWLAETLRAPAPGR